MPLFNTGTCRDCGEEVSAIAPDSPAIYCQKCGTIESLRAKLAEADRERVELNSAMEFAAKHHRGPLVESPAQVIRRLIVTRNELERENARLHAMMPHPSWDDDAAGFIARLRETATNTRLRCPKDPGESCASCHEAAEMLGALEMLDAERERAETAETRAKALEATAGEYLARVDYCLTADDLTLDDEAERDKFERRLRALLAPAEPIPGPMLPPLPGATVEEVERMAMCNAAVPAEPKDEERRKEVTPCSCPKPPGPPDPPRRCLKCGGMEGYAKPLAPAGHPEPEQPRPRSEEVGTVSDKPCATCGGRGWVVTERTVYEDRSIPCPDCRKDGGA